MSGVSFEEGDACRRGNELWRLFTVGVCKELQDEIVLNQMKENRVLRQQLAFSIWALAYCDGEPRSIEEVEEQISDAETQAQLGMDVLIWGDTLRWLKHKVRKALHYRLLDAFNQEVIGEYVKFDIAKFLYEYGVHGV